MSHTLVYNSSYRLHGQFTITVVNYVLGGENFTAAEFGSGLNIIPVINPSARNSLGSTLFAQIVGGNVKLFRIVSGALTEVPTTSGLNAIFDVLIFST